MLDEEPQGEAVGSVYLVQYSEDLWLALPEETREFSKETWRKKAAAIRGTRFVMLRLLPDALFPLHGHESSYAAWQEPIEQAAPDCGYALEPTIVVRLTDTPNYIDPVRRAAISRALEGFGHKASWQIVTKGGSILEHGVL